MSGKNLRPTHAEALHDRKYRALLLATALQALQPHERLISVVERHGQRWLVVDNVFVAELPELTAP